MSALPQGRRRDRYYGLGYVTDALLHLPFEGGKPYETDFSVDTNGHLGQAATVSGGVIGRPGKFGKAVQVAEAVTNMVLNPVGGGASSIAAIASATVTTQSTTQRGFIAPITKPITETITQSKSFSFTPRLTMTGKATSTIQVQTPQVEQIKTTSTKQEMLLETIPLTTATKTRTLTLGRVAQLPAQTTKTKTDTITTTVSALRTDTITKMKTPTIRIGTFPPSSPPTFPTPKPQIPFFIPPFGLNVDGMSGLKKIKASRKYSYFPSFKAIVFGIRGKGKAPSSEKKWTGLEVRPIYSGFGLLTKTPKKRKALNRSNG